MGRKRKGIPPQDSSVTKRAAKQIEPIVLEFLNRTPGRGYQIKQILKGLNIRDAKSKGIVTEVIFRLEDSGKIKKLRNINNVTFYLLSLSFYLILRFLQCRNI